jgi:hypothetical protein
MESKRKLLVVAGAGSSIDFGMPSVDAVGQVLRQAALPDFQLADDPSRSLYDHIRDAIIKCQRRRQIVPDSGVKVYQSG